MKRIISLLVVMAMMLASVLAIIPVAATTPVEDNDVVVENNAADDGAGDAATEETPAEVTRFLPDGVMDKIKAVFEADGAGTSKYEAKPTAPFVNNSEQAQKAFEGKRLLKIWAPIKKAAAVDANGDLHFTLSVATIANLKAAPVAEYSIKVNAEEYGITPNSDVNKVIEVNLYDYNIVVGEGQCLVLGGNDTAWLAWESHQDGAINTILKADAPYAVEFSPSVGTDSYDVKHWGTSIFYDVEMIDADAEVPVEYYGKAISTVDELKAIEAGKSYYLTTDLTLPANYASVAFANGTFDGKGHTITYTGTAPLFAMFENATLKNVTIAGSVTVDSAVVTGTKGAVVFDNVDVKLAAMKVGYVPSWQGNMITYTFKNCDNYTPMNTTSAGAFSSGINSGSVIIENCSNNANITGTDYVGAFLAHVWAPITIKDSRNGSPDAPITIKATKDGGGVAGGFVGGSGKGNLTIINSKNYAAIESTATAGGLVGMFPTSYSANGHTLTINGCENYGKVTAGNGQDAGGFAGKVNGMNGNENKAVVLSISDSNNYGEIVGSLTGGGAVGWANGIASLSIENCGNYANISGRYVGGLVGASHTTATLKNVVVGSADKVVTIKGSAEFTGGVIGQARVTNIDGAVVFANVSATGGKVGGVIGESSTIVFKNVITATKDAKTSVTSTGNNSYIGGFVGHATDTASFENCTNNAVTSGNTESYGGGFVAALGTWEYYKKADGSNDLDKNPEKVSGGTSFIAKNCVNNADNNVKGSWWRSGGGFLGQVANADTTISFTDCVNNGNMWFEGSAGNNAGGFFGGFHRTPAYKSISFVRCTNNGNISSTGNVGGFLGQGGGQNYYFEDCVNNGKVHSVNNLAGGFFGWGAGNGALTAIRCYNYGDIYVNKHPDPKQLNKKAAGFCAGRGVVANMTDCVNFGNMSSDEGDAAGLLIDVASANLVRCYNVGNVKAGVYNGTARVRYELSSGALTLRDCMVTNFHADIIAKVKTIPLYADIYDKTDYPALVAAVNAATAVYDKADATAEDKAAAIAAIDAAISDLTTWMEVSPDAAAIGGVINVTADSINAEGKDWIGLVKNGEDVATVWAYLTDIQAAENGFNILNGTYADGKELVEGEYTLYFVPNNATIAEVLAGEVEALATKDVIISGKAITTPEQFIAMGETGDYILGCDIVLPTNYVAATWSDNQWSNLKIFKGTFDGRGHSITLQTNNSLFYKLDGATIKNLTLEGGKLEGGLTHLVAGTVNFENVDVMINSITRGWGGIGPDEKTGYKPLLGAFVDVVTDADVVVNFYNCVANTSIQADAFAGGFVGHASAGQVNFYGCTSGVSKGSSTITSSTTWDNGQGGGGFIGTLNGGTAYFEDCVNNSTVVGNGKNNARQAIGGFVGLIKDGGKKATFVDCTNNGDIGNTVSGNAGGFIGAYTCNNTTTLVEFDGCVNLGNVITDRSAGGFIGLGKGVVTVTNCQNGAKKNDITIGGNGGSSDAGSAGFAGYFAGQITISDNTEDGSGFGFKNYAFIQPRGNHSAAGIIALFANDSNGAVNVFRGTEVYNYGDIDTWDGWHYGDGGMIANGKWRDDVEIYFVDSENHGNVLYSTSSNKGGFVGYAERGNVYSFINCKNYGSVSAAGNASGFVGQAKVVQNNVADGINNIYFESCENHGNITATLGATGFIGGYAQVDNSFIIKDSANYGRIHSTNANQAAAGFSVDLKGEGTKVYTNCVNYGIIISDKAAAGIAAWIGNKTTFENCDNEGQIVSMQNATYAFDDGAATKDEACENNGYLINREDVSTFEPIWTAEDFMNIKPEGFYILMDNIVLPEDYKSIVFGTNIYTGGILEGNGKTIYMKGLTNALFHELYNATIRNFNVVGTLTFSGDGAALIQNLKCNKGATISGITLNVDVTAKTAAGFVRWYDKNNKTTINITDCAYLGNITGTDYTSAIFGGGVNGTLNITNVTVGSKTEKTTITGKNRVGAFFSEPSGQGGAAEAKNNVINVTNCVNYADIKQISNGDEGCAGSLAGRFCFVTVNVDGFTNYGDVDSNRTTGWQQGVGGVIGEINQNAYANLDNVTNYGDVYSNKSVVGGIVGAVTNRSYLVINNATNFGKVSNGSGWNFAIGGIVGGAAFGDNDTTDDNSPENIIEVYNSVNYGEVYSTGSNKGGILGWVEKTSEASKVVIDTCANYGKIHGNNNNGGIFGQGGGIDLTINNCSNYGNIQTDAQTEAAAGIASLLGGGDKTNLVITNNVNYGTITATKNAASGIMVNYSVKADGTAIISGNINYGTIIGAAGKDTLAIVREVNNTIDEFLGNVNYGIIASATGAVSPAVTESETMTAVVNEGVILTDADLIAIAKALNPMWYYTEEEWFGTAAVEPEAPEAPEVPETSDEVVEEVAPANDGEEVTEPVEVLGILEALKAAQAVKENVKAAQALVEALTADYEEAAAALTEAEAALEAAKKVVDELAGTSNTEALEAATEALVVADQNHASAILAKTEASTALETATAIAEDLAANQEEDRAAAVEALNASIASALDRTEMINLYLDLMKLDTENLGIDAEAWMEAVTKMEEATTQEELDAAVSEMKAVLAAAIDYSALKAQYERYLALKLEDYTAASVRDLELVIEKFKEYEVEDLTQDIVDEFAAELKAAIDALRDDFYIIEDANIFLEGIDALDPDDYTAPTWAIVKELRDELVAAIKAEDLDEVESLIYIIELAIVEQLIEVGTLKDLVAEIEALDEANYSNFSWINVPSAVVIAKTILTAVEEETIEKDTAEAYIAEAIAFVTGVLEGLVDVSELKANIADAKAEAEGNYTVATLAALKTAIANAEITVSIAKTAEEVEAANKALVAAIDALEELVEVDASTLEELIAAVEALNAADYTAATWAAVKEALAAAKIAVNAAAQADVDAAFAALDAAKTALVTKPNTEALAGAIADVEALVAGDYTAETWAVLVEALKAAKAALASDVQADVDAAKAALDTAKAALAAKVAADTSALSALIAEIEALKSADYTSDSWATLKAALDAAKAVLDSDDQNAIDLAKALLDVAKAGLTKVEVDAPEVDDEDEDDDETDKPATTEPAKKKGCGSVIGATAVVLTAVLGLGATVVLKKKED